MSENLSMDPSAFFVKTMTGSVEFQIDCLTKRVLILTRHLKKHSKDYSSQRGLWKILGKRKRLLQFLYNSNINSYKNLITQLGIRGPIKF
jgi:small subunit ribosomal protein S15|uniref:ribosomal protein S15 n=1 Tax=Equisetum palustre TaxID=113538 RepID=UPI0030FECBB7